MLNYIEYLNIPVKIALVLVVIFFSIQIIGEFLEFKGKVVPEFLKIRKWFARKKNEKTEAAQTLKNVQVLLNDVNSHYSADSIAKRDDWIQWVNNRAEIYDESIKQLKETLLEITQALKDNNKLTEEMFIQSSRDRIIDFATKVADEKSIVSREEFNRIFKVYNKYEKYLEEHELTNGEVDIAHRIIQESYKQRIRTHSFIEDARGYTKVDQ